jgi:uncharacterized protein (TIGR02453 family)
MSAAPTTAFRGFPPEALTFFAGLEADNSRGYWAAHADVYAHAVRAPMEALIAAVDERYRPLRIFRPQRDVRFATDKSPYKTHIGAVGEDEGGVAYYVALSATGLVAASGYYGLAKDQLGRYRAAVADDRTGADLAARVAAARAGGCELHQAELLKTAPRGVPRDHPRLDLLRRKGLAVGRTWPPAAWLHTGRARSQVEAVWARAEPVNEWLRAHVGPSELPPDDGWR